MAILIEELIELNGDDKQYLISLSGDFFNEYQQYGELYKSNKIDETGILSYFLIFIQNENKSVFVERNDKIIIGYLTCYEKEQTAFFKINKIGEISGFMVNMEYWKIGVGKLLFNEAKKAFLRKGIKYYSLYTSKNNKSALSFYKNIGMDEYQVILIGEII